LNAAGEATTATEETLQIPLVAPPQTRRLDIEVDGDVGVGVTVRTVGNFENGVTLPVAIAEQPPGD